MSHCLSSFSYFFLVSSWVTKMIICFAKLNGIVFYVLRLCTNENFGNQADLSLCNNVGTNKFSIIRNYFDI